MGKILFGLLFMVSMLFAQLDLNTATKQELMQIKGVGAKKAEAIIKYRKNNSIKSVEDLQKIKGFGKKLISNIKNEVKNKTKTSKKLDKKSKTKA